ncbi:type II toxin-antitoxin system VapC family toxin [Anaerocellum danielii]|uniref:Type II toxin-antitoxin system VapC family toxin n=1 Tax=Anaerocellum danielii TaxID=1387557 RepID=A0ABZ0U1I2_9FIRM|nr:type II toxin-antitoxin system VapC family toxin [Caldicellulosiruptor danielii]WPX08583.1 type II toxin-antitoxin system VapC family toxin [Caldicellulosiruptor danielii]
MKRLKVYLDTSVISHLDQPDNKEYMEITLEFWEQLVKGEYEIFISEVVLAELRRCPEPKKTKLYQKLEQIEYTEILINEEIDNLAERYLDEKIISPKYRDDAIHIAAATFAECDVLVSWNFKHIVKTKTIFGVNGINKLMGYKEIQLVSPNMMLEEE